MVAHVRRLSRVAARPDRGARNESWLVDEQLDEDLGHIVADVVNSPKLQEIFAELKWPPRAVARLQSELLDDAFRSRVQARHDKVADRSTSLDQHLRDTPPWFPDDGWWLLTRRQGAFCVIPVGSGATLANAPPAFQLSM